MIQENEPLLPIYHILYVGNKEGVKGHNVEKYFDDFETVRIVDANTIAERTQSWDYYNGHMLKKHTLSIKKFYSSGKKIENFSYMQCPPDTYQNCYRDMVKMQWLCNNILDSGLREPVTVVTYPLKDKDIGKIRYDSVVHPGTFRWYAFQICDVNPDCIVFDPFDTFMDFPKATLSECLDLFSEDSDKYEIAILPNNDNYLTPQIMNMKDGSTNASMEKVITEYEEKVREHWHSPINIFVGYDSRHGDVHETCIKSIKLSSPDIDVNNINIIPLDISKIPEYTREWANQSVEFTYSRFLAPYLSDYKGWSIFVDNDYLFEADILNLLWFIDDTKAVSVVQHDFEKKHDTKFGDVENVWYDKKLWSSLMVFNNQHPDCKKLTPDVINTASGKYLHQFEWTENIGRIPNKWAWQEGYSHTIDFDTSRSKHWTRGGYWINNMDCEDIYGLNVHSAYRYLENKFPSMYKSYIDPRKYFYMDFIARKDNSKYCKQKKLGD